METSVVPDRPPQERPLRHRILMVHPPAVVSQIDLSSHELSLASDLDAADEAVASERPDMVVLFAAEGSTEIEQHVMTWLVEGFKGKLILFDPHEVIPDPTDLVSGQVVDDFFPGPVSIHRFTTILQNKMLQGTRFAAPRAMTTYDLFRNLFDRGLSAIFFFTDDLDRCVAANLKAEDLTGYTFAELKRMKLESLCDAESWERTLRAIRRAKHRYFDAKGVFEILDKSGGRKRSEFSCGYFPFGRRQFVKIEVQTLQRGAAV
ncbi:PAS domain-containing protein [bacterium]|nr:MAG: PAS domain-containing protein [bacterium]